MEELGPCYPLYHSTKATEQSLMSKFDNDRIRAGFFSAPCPPQGTCRTQLGEEVYFRCHLKLRSFAFFQKNGTNMKKQRCHREGCEDAPLKWNLGALQWDKLSGDHPCRVLKECRIWEKAKLLQMASGAVNSGEGSVNSGSCSLHPPTAALTFSAFSCTSAFWEERLFPVLVW